MDATTSCNTTTASLSSATLSQNYLTPASSVISRSQRHSNPHVTGTVQPYLKKSHCQARKRTPTSKAGQISSSDSTISRSSISTTSSTVATSRSGTSQAAAGRVNQSISRQSSSTVSFKTAISSSAPNLKPIKSTSNFKKTPSSVSFKTALSHESVTTAPSASTSVHSVNSPLAQHTAESLNTETSQAAQQSSGETSCTVNAPQDPLTDAATLDSSPTLNQCLTHSQHLTATDDAIPASCLPSRVLTTGVQLPLDKEPATITLAELDKLWMDFLASSLGRNQPEGAATSLSRPTARKPTTPTTPREQPVQDTLETRDTAIQTTPSLALSEMSHYNQQQVFIYTYTLSLTYSIHSLSSLHHTSHHHHTSHISHCKRR